MEKISQKKIPQQTHAQNTTSGDVLLKKEEKLQKTVLPKFDDDIVKTSLGTSPDTLAGENGAIANPSDLTRKNDTTVTSGHSAKKNDTKVSPDNFDEKNTVTTNSESPTNKLNRTANSNCLPKINEASASVNNRAYEKNTQGRSGNNVEQNASPDKHVDTKELDGQPGTSEDDTHGAAGKQGSRRVITRDLTNNRNEKKNHATHSPENRTQFVKEADVQSHIPKPEEESLGAVGGHENENDNDIMDQKEPDGRLSAKSCHNSLDRSTLGLSNKAVNPKVSDPFMSVEATVGCVGQPTIRPTILQSHLDHKQDETNTLSTKAEHFSSLQSTVRNENQYSFENTAKVLAEIHTTGEAGKAWWHVQKYGEGKVTVERQIDNTGSTVGAAENTVDTADNTGNTVDTARNTVDTADNTGNTVDTARNTVDTADNTGNSVDAAKNTVNTAENTVNTADNTGNSVDAAKNTVDTAENMGNIVDAAENTGNTVNTVENRVDAVENTGDTVDTAKNTGNTVDTAENTVDTAEHIVGTAENTVDTADNTGSTVDTGQNTGNTVDTAENTEHAVYSAEDTGNTVDTAKHIVRTADIAGSPVRTVDTADNTEYANNIDHAAEIADTTVRNTDAAVDNERTGDSVDNPGQAVDTAGDTVRSPQYQHPNASPQPPGGRNDTLLQGNNQQASPAQSGWQTSMTTSSGSREDPRCDTGPSNREDGLEVLLCFPGGSRHSQRTVSSRERPSFSTAPARRPAYDPERPMLGDRAHLSRSIVVLGRYHRNLNDQHVAVQPSPVSHPSHNEDEVVNLQNASISHDSTDYVDVPGFSSPLPRPPNQQLWDGEEPDLFPPGLSGHQQMPSDQLLAVLITHFGWGRGYNGNPPHLGLCPVCHRHRVNVIFLNCHHVLVCCVCARSLGICPECEQLCRFAVFDPDFIHPY